MLTLTFLGVGGAFAKRNFQSNLLIEAWSERPENQFAPDDTLIVDFGTTGPLALHQLKDQPGFQFLNCGGYADYTRLNKILVTHLHSDHVGGLAELALANIYVMPRLTKNAGFKPSLIATNELLRGLWENSLKAGLGILNGREARLEDYFHPEPIASDRPADSPALTLLDRYQFRAVPSDHVRIRRPLDWPSYSVLARDAYTGQTAFFSGDTRYAFNNPEVELGACMTAARICFHDVQLVETADSVHALLNELLTMPAEVRKKTYLYHYSDNWDDDEYSFVSDEFAGFAVPFYRYVLFD